MAALAIPRVGLSGERTKICSKNNILNYELRRKLDPAVIDNDVLKINEIFLQTNSDTIALALMIPAMFVIQ